MFKDSSSFGVPCPFPPFTATGNTPVPAHTDPLRVTLRADVRHDPLASWGISRSDTSVFRSPVMIWTEQTAGEGGTSMNIPRQHSFIGWHWLRSRLCAQLLLIMSSLWYVFSVKTLYFFLQKQAINKHLIKSFSVRMILHISFGSNCCSLLPKLVQNYLNSEISLSKC